MHTVLVVDDETDILELVAFNLERQQFMVITVDASLRIGDLLLGRNTLMLFLAGQPVQLTATEFKLLRLVVEVLGEVQERHVLLLDVSGYSDTMLTRTLDTHIKRLREKLGKY